MPQRMLHALPGRRLCLLLAMHLLATHLPAMAQTAWPEVALPGQARSYPIGPQMDLNGLPMRVTGFASPATAEQTADWFLRRLGPPLTDQRLDGRRILGRAQGEHYITIQIEPGADGRGSRGLVAVSHLRAALQGRERYQRDTARWRRLLPAGTEVTSLLTSRDGDRLSTHLIATNRHSVQLNAQRLTALLQEQGYGLENHLDGSDQAQPSRQQVQGTTLLLRGPGKEAMAVITRDMRAGHGLQEQTRIVLTTSIQRESLQ